jgi:hypothetical protein
MTVTKNAAEKTILAPIISSLTDNQRFITWAGHQARLLSSRHICGGRVVRQDSRGKVQAGESEVEQGQGGIHKETCERKDQMRM